MTARKFSLPNKKIEIRPIKKATSFIPDLNHVASFLAPGAKRIYTTPIARNGQYVAFLTEEEREFLESPESGLALKTSDLSFYKKENNYFDELYVELGKSTISWDLSNPHNYIAYKMLLANTDDIAPSEQHVKRKPTYKYVIVDLNEVLEQKSKEVDLEELAWEQFGKIKKSRAKMINVLKVFGKRVSENVSDDFLKSEIKKIMDSPGGFQKFIDLCNDEDFDLKVLIEDAIANGVLVKERSKYMFVEGDMLGVDLFDAINALKDTKNQNTLLMLKTKLKNSK